jgi:hypothetical protein
VNDNAAIAKKKLTDARRYSSANYQQMVDVSKENRDRLHNAYTNLTLFSGGTIALSITYYGYLKAAHTCVQYPFLLKVSWIVLMVCVISSVLYHQFFSWYTTYAAEGNSRKAKAAELDYEGSTESLQYIDPSEDMRVYKHQLKQEAEDFRKQATDAAKKENFYFLAYVWSGYSAHGAFILGLTLLLAFAMCNG